MGKGSGTTRTVGASAAASSRTSAKAVVATGGGKNDITNLGSGELHRKLIELGKEDGILWALSDVNTSYYSEKYNPAMYKKFQQNVQDYLNMSTSASKKQIKSIENGLDGIEISSIKDGVATASVVFKAYGDSYSTVGTYKYETKYYSSTYGGAWNEWSKKIGLHTSSYSEEQTVANKIIDQSYKNGVRVTKVVLKQYYD